MSYFASGRTVDAAIRTPHIRTDSQAVEADVPILAGRRQRCLRLLPLPQRLDAVFDAIKDEAAHVAMSSRPLSVLRVGAASVRRRVEVIPRVMRVRMG